MKKLLLILSVLLLVAGCTQKDIKKADITGIKELTYTQVKEEMNKEESFILYIGRPDCGDCNAFEPKLENYLKENKDTGVYYFNIKSYRDASKKENASKEDIDTFEEMRKTLDFNWTPTLDLIEDGKITSQYTYLDEAYYEIKDREAQIKRREEFEQEFQTFMDNYFKE